MGRCIFTFINYNIKVKHTKTLKWLLRNPEHKKLGRHLPEVLAAFVDAGAGKVTEAGVETSCAGIGNDTGRKVESFTTKDEN